MNKVNGTHYKPEKWKGAQHNDPAYEKFDMLLHWRKNGTTIEFYSFGLFHRSSATDEGYTGVDPWNPALNSVSNVSNAWINLTIPEKINLIILINGVPHQKKETEVKNGDIVAIFPPLAGG